MGGTNHCCCCPNTCAACKDSCASLKMQTTLAGVPAQDCGLGYDCSSINGTRLMESVQGSCVWECPVSGPSSVFGQTGLMCGYDGSLIVTFAEAGAGTTIDGRLVFNHPSDPGNVITLATWGITLSDKPDCRALDMDLPLISASPFLVNCDLTNATLNLRSAP